MAFSLAYSWKNSGALPASMTSFWRIFWFWHACWHSIARSVWHLALHFELACHLTFYLASCLTFFQIVCPLFCLKSYQGSSLTSYVAVYCLATSCKHIYIYIYIYMYICSCNLSGVLWTILPLFRVTCHWPKWSSAILKLSDTNHPSTEHQSCPASRQSWAKALLSTGGLCTYTLHDWYMIDTQLHCRQYPCRMSDILSDILPGILSGIRSGMHSDMLSGSPSDTWPAMFSGLQTDIQSDMHFWAFHVTSSYFGFPFSIRSYT